jgi:hypothetical protein
MSANFRRATRALAASFAVATLLSAAAAAHAQTGYYASIAYSQKTGRVGYSARQARTKEPADAFAIRMCASPDAKVFMWARDQWVAVAVVDGQVGNAGFGRGGSSTEAQQKALDECAKHAGALAYRVALCVHSSGQRVQELRSVAAKPVKSKTGYFAALAFSPSTGKIGQTVAAAKTVDEAKKLALKDCDAPDAKVFMWGDLWVAIAVAPDTAGVAGFGPGATREEAEKAALEQCTKLAKGAAVKIERAIYSTGEENPTVIPASAAEPVAAVKPASTPSRQRTNTAGK